MKAIVMAGGAGTRLRPLSSGLPKPMVPFFDRPVLEHIINLLKKHDITEIMITLQYKPKMVSDYFGDGSRFGVSISYHIETEPLGTAGGVRACEDFWREGDFLVISGDAVCDVDLSAFLAYHQEKNSKASIMLHKCRSPLEYGLVITNNKGRIIKFVEKPSWGQVYTDEVNTGIYILSPEVMQKTPKNKPYDFARDLFRILLETGCEMYAYTAGGYWCDIGDPEAYRQAHYDLLDGRLSLGIEGGSIISLSPLPENLRIAGPCYIGEGVEISPDAVIGAYNAIYSGSKIGAAAIRGSIIIGAEIEDGAQINRSIICNNAVVEKDAGLSEGCVLGAGSRLGRGAQAAPFVKIWPDKTINDSVTGNIIGGGAGRGHVFTETGKLKGCPDFDLTPEYCIRLGMAAASLSHGEAGIGFSGGEGARALAEAFSCGICATGKTAVIHDAPTASACAYAGELLGFYLSAFFLQNEEDINLYIYGPSGAELSRPEMRDIELIMSKNEYPRVRAEDFGHMRKISGVSDAYQNAAAVCALSLPVLPEPEKKRFFASKNNFIPQVIIKGSDPGQKALRKACAQLGFKILEEGRNVFSLTVGEDGRSLSAQDEGGRIICERELFTILCDLEFELGAKVLAVPFSAPHVLEAIAEKYGGSLLRTGREDERAERLYYTMPFMRDGVFAGARLCMALMRTKKSLKERYENIPAFKTVSKELPLSLERGEIMKKIAKGFAHESCDYGDGLSISLERGFLHVVPDWTKKAVRVTGEAYNMETASDLFDLLDAVIKPENV